MTNPFDTFISTNTIKEDYLQDIVDKKSFKKLFFRTYAELVGDDSENKFKFGAHQKMMTNYLRVIQFLHQIYLEDFNYDILLKYVDQIVYFIPPTKPITNAQTWAWIKENISMNSMLNMISMEIIRRSKKKNSIIEYGIVNSEFYDMIKMMSDILDHDGELVTISPLRFGEYHNKLVRIHLRATITKVDYTQYFLKTPYVKENIEVIEPTNSYELAEWATTVKNCVYSRESSILNGSSAILLFKENGQPKFTAEILNPTIESKFAIGEIDKIYRTNMTQEERQKVQSIVQEIMQSKIKNS